MKLVRDLPLEQLLAQARAHVASARDTVSRAADLGRDAGVAIDAALAWYGEHPGLARGERSISPDERARERSRLLTLLEANQRELRERAAAEMRAAASWQERAAIARDGGRPDLAQAAETRAHEHREHRGQLEQEAAALDAPLATLRELATQPSDAP